MMGHPKVVSGIDWGGGDMSGSYDLIESLCCTQTCWPSANDQDIDVAIRLSTPRTFFLNRFSMESGLHLLPIGLADLPLVSHCVYVVLYSEQMRSEWTWK
jgi:hypothetical protein